MNIFLRILILLCLEFINLNIVCLKYILILIGVYLFTNNYWL